VTTSYNPLAHVPEGWQQKLDWHL